MRHLAIISLCYKKDFVQNSIPYLDRGYKEIKFGYKRLLYQFYL